MTTHLWASSSARVEAVDLCVVHAAGAFVESCTSAGPISCGERSLSSQLHRQILTSTSKDDITHRLRAGHEHGTHYISTSTSKDEITHFLRVGHGHGTIRFRQAPQKMWSRTSWERDMGVVPSDFDKHLKRRHHAPTESSTWAWYHQISTSTSKDDITHWLRARHGRGTIRFRQAPQKARSCTLWELYKHTIK